MKKLPLTLAILVVALGLVAWSVYRKTDTVVAVGAASGMPLIEISGPLDAAGARKVVSALQRAEQNRPAMILVSFESPGGEIAGTLKVADTLAGLSVPVIGWVKESQGGTVLLMAAVDRIYFSPAGVCASAASVVGSDNPDADRMMQKLQNLLATKISDWAEARGHDPDIFLALVDPNVELIHDGVVWKQKGQALVLTADEALKLGLSSGTAASPEEMIAKQAMQSDGRR